MTFHESEPISVLIRTARRKRELSQRGLARALMEASGLDTITRCDVSRWERGKRIPKGFWLHWLAEVLQIPLARLRHAASVTRKARKDLVGTSSDIRLP